MSETTRVEVAWGVTFDYLGVESVEFFDSEQHAREEAQSYPVGVAQLVRVTTEFYD